MTRAGTLADQPRCSTRRSLCGSAAILALAVLLACAPGASGHRVHGFGGNWPHTAGKDLYLPYAAGGRGLTRSWVALINGAMKVWYDTRTEVWPYPVARRNVVYFNVAFVKDTYWGITYDYANRRICYGVGCSYSFSLIVLNRGTLDEERQFTRQKVVVHEFGHALGLSHPCAGGRCPNLVRSIMNQGYLRYNVPQNHDVNDINRMYP